MLVLLDGDGMIVGHALNDPEPTGLSRPKS